MQFSSLSRWFSWLLLSKLFFQSASQLWFRRKWKIWMSHLNDSFPALKTKELPNSIIQYAKRDLQWGHLLCGMFSTRIRRVEQDTEGLWSARLSVRGNWSHKYYWFQWQAVASSSTLVTMKSVEEEKEKARRSGSTMWGRLRLCSLDCRLVFLSSVLLCFSKNFTICNKNSSFAFWNSVYALAAAC